MRYLLCLCLMLAVSACAMHPGSATSSREQVAQATAAWKTAYDSREPGRITQMYSTDAALWGTTSKAIAPTPADIADYFKGAAARPNARVTFNQQHIRVYGDVAVNSGAYTFSDVRDGQTTMRPARYSMVFRNTGGKWLLVDHHSSFIP